MFTKKNERKTLINKFKDELLMFKYNIRKMSTKSQDNALV